MSDGLGRLLGFLAVCSLGAFVIKTWLAGRDRKSQLEHEQERTAAAAADPADAGVDSSAPNYPIPEIYRALQPLAEIYNVASLPTELSAHPAFMHCAQLLNADEYSDAQLLQYVYGEHVPLRCIAYQAIALRGTAFTELDRLLAHLPRQPGWVLYFGLRAAAACAPSERRTVADLLVSICIEMNAYEWLATPPSVEYLREYIRERKQQGEPLEFDKQAMKKIADANEEAEMQYALERIGHDVTRSLSESLKQPLVEETATDDDASAVDRPDRESTTPNRHEARRGAMAGELATLGRVWTKVPTAAGRHVHKHTSLDEHVKQVLQCITSRGRRSCVLVGEPGVGKRTVLEALAGRLLERDWLVLEAGHTDIIADQKYIGMFEGRLKEYISQMRRRKRLWFIPDLSALLATGRHDASATGALQLLLPHIENGGLCVVGTVTPSAYEALVQNLPGVRHVFDIIRVSPLAGEQTVEVTRAWLDAERERSTSAPVPENDQVLREAWLLAEQFLGDRAAPGNLMQLISRTCRRGGRLRKSTTFDRDDLITTLGELTGLPTFMLDDQQSFELQSMREFFAQRILGQAEAVECLIQRVAMMKAGLTDPTRPQGVFLFAGPTGTGKTEIAKVLAEYLFGSQQRMIRVDMSEYKDHGAAHRLLQAMDHFAGTGSGTLVSQVRQQPFSVLLLDEFEKAATDVWDLFLQVFDDGRLTDDQGNTVDFRHTIIIVTSNLGAVVPVGTGLGFSREGDVFRPADVRKAIDSTFRKEFINRFDRQVIFKPFTRETMRELLRLELRKADRRRGLRHRDWAMIWDDSAIDFLLEKGFTADLGARPLRRAVERYLLAPLSEVIATGRLPAGDQFLFIHAGDDGLVTEFVDPDATEPTAEDRLEPTPAQREAGGHETPVRIMLSPRGGRRELDSLLVGFAELNERLAATGWQERKQEAFRVMSQPGFWETEDRFRVLGQAEYMDRIDSGLESAGALLEKLNTWSQADSGGKGYRRCPTDLVGKLAQRLYLLDAAIGALEHGVPWEAYVLIDADDTSGQRESETDGWGQRLAEMYRQWARARRMKLDVLAETGGDGSRPWSRVIAVSGYAAYTLLQAENGLHVWEEPTKRGGGNYHRRQVRVRVVPQPVVPTANRREQQIEADRLLAEPSAENLRIVRLYREQPSPLVRDRIRGWRTGRLEQVLGGAFDLLAD